MVADKELRSTGMGYWGKRCVSAWVTIDQFLHLHRIARYHKISVAEYVRAIIVDALEEEKIE